MSVNSGLGDCAVQICDWWIWRQMLFKHFIFYVIHHVCILCYTSLLIFLINKNQFPCAFCSWTIYFAHSHTMNCFFVCWFCGSSCGSMSLSSQNHFHTNRQTLCVLHWQFITQHHYSLTHYTQHHYSLSVIYTFSFHVKVKPKGKNQTNGDLYIYIINTVISHHCLHCNMHGGVSSWFITGTVRWRSAVFPNPKSKS